MLLRCAGGIAIPAFRPALFRSLADTGVFEDIQSEPRDQCFQVIEVWAGGTMVIILRDAGG